MSLGLLDDSWAYNRNLLGVSDVCQGQNNMQGCRLIQDGPIVAVLLQKCVTGIAFRKRAQEHDLLVRITTRVIPISSTIPLRYIPSFPASCQYTLSGMVGF